MEITTDYCKDYYGNNIKKHRNYDNCVDKAFHVQFHLDGYYQKPYMAKKQQSLVDYEEPERINPYFMWIVDDTRPSESSYIKSYRRKVYLPKTKNPVRKVYSILKKIIKSPDWAINYPDVPAADLNEKDCLEYYCEKTFPRFDSIENWFKQVGLRQMISDPNSLVVVMPNDLSEWSKDEQIEEGKEGDTEFAKPYPFLIPSKNVYEFIDGKVAIFKSPWVHEYQDSEKKWRKSSVTMFLTCESLWQCYKENDDESLILEEVWKHNIGEMPAWIMGGDISEDNGLATVYDSFIDPMLPDLDDMARLFSDHQGEIIQHVYSTMYYWDLMQCTACSGSGFVNPKGKKSICTSCNGSGNVLFTPMSHIKLKVPDKTKMEGSDIPIPPMGYITKPTDMVKLQKELIDMCSYQALSAVNLEFLGREPVIGSGTAKAYDQDAGNAYIGDIAYHIVENVLNPIYYFVNMVRYGVYKKWDEDKLNAQLPTINIPEKFDFITENMLEEKMINLKKADVAPEIVRQSQIEYVNKKYYNEPEIRDTLVMKYKHDPFPNLDEEGKIGLEASGLATKKDIILSLYIDDFTEDMVQRIPGIFDMEYDDVKELYYMMADEKIEELDGEMADGNVYGNYGGYGSAEDNGGYIKVSSKKGPGSTHNANTDFGKPTDVVQKFKNRQTKMKPAPKHNNLRNS